MSSKTETFYLESAGEAETFCKSCQEEGMTAVLLPPEEQDGRMYYPIKVTFDSSKLKK